MKTQITNSHFIRRIRASWRDTLLLFREFSWPLSIFIFIMIGGGILYYRWSIQAGEPLSSLTEAIYLVLGLTFLQSSIEFPQDWHLQLFFFIMPILGIGLLAQGVAEFGALFFNHRARGKEWEMAVASTLNNHIILAGLGHLGFQALNNLLDMNQDVVVIELDPDADLIETVRDMGAPVLIDDASRENTLIDAGINKAKTIMMCTQNDSVNLQIAVKARSLNPDIKVVLRIFDHDFAEALQNQFGFIATSSSQIAGPAFAAAAAGVEMTRPITIAGLSLRLTRFDIKPNSKLANKTIENIEQQYDATIVLVKHKTETDVHPPADTLILEGDSVVMLAEVRKLSTLIQANG
ncbi:potassium channel family protein [Chloroflexota bacterium]